MTAVTILSDAQLDALAAKVAAHLQAGNPAPVAPHPTRRDQRATAKSEFLTLSEVCEILRVSAPTIRRMRKDGRLSCYADGTRSIRFKLSEVEAALRQK